MCLLEDNFGRKNSENESLWIMLKTGRQLLFESHCMFYEKVIKRSSFFEN